MFDQIINNLPLTPAAKALESEILSIPRTDEPIYDDLPEGIEIKTIERLHDLAVSGSQHAAPELRKLIARFPDFPKLVNYLQVAHNMRKETRQAEAALKLLAERHPDYLFTRVALCTRAFDKDRPEQAAAQLGPSLDIRDLYPDRKIFHISELRNYYLHVARVLARRDQPDLALGVKKALAAINFHKDIDDLITHEVMMANVRVMRKRMEEDARRRVTVRPAPLPENPVTTTIPSFRHEAITHLYRHHLDIPEECVEEILALPRETLVRDLIAVLEDCAIRTPDFSRNPYEDSENFAPVHALHLLAEVHGTEACEALLGLLAIHPLVVDFWLGNTDDYQPQIARIITGDLPACFAWLKLPGIGCRPRGMIAEAMGQLAKSEPQRLPEITAGLGETLGFLIDSPPEDNILDTGFIFILISVLTELRATGQLPVIRRAYEKELVELFQVGTLESVEQDMMAPLQPPMAWLPMMEQYEEYEYGPIDEGEDEGYEDEDDVYFPPPRIPGLGTSISRTPLPAPKPPAANRLAAPAGRNDPCPCGSGRKHKKCCME